MSSQPSSENELFRILDSFLGKSRLPGRKELEEKYPHLADQLWECLEGMALLRGGASVSSERVVQEETLPEISEKTMATAPIGDFQILREIGRGGMGVVYEARQCSLGRRVALKVLPFASTFDPRQLQRFHNEATAAAQLEHPSIVPIYAIGSERGIHYYAMRLINGQHLGNLIRQLREENHIPENAPDDTTSLFSTTSESSSIPPEVTSPEGNFHVTTQVSQLYSGHRQEFYRTVAALMKQAADALDYAHQCGVIHRDIKPGNLLVDEHAKLWITDFGLAHICSSVQLTQTGEVFGTPRYMSPEQASGKVRASDHRVDIYSLGATFYECLTLHPIFETKNQVQLLRQITSEDPTPPHEHDSRIPHDLETILLKTLEKNPLDRYESAGELAKDLERFLENRPIQAKRPGFLEITRKYLWRHPSVVAGGIFVMAVAWLALLVNHHLVSQERNKTVAALSEAQTRFEKARLAADALIDIVEKDLDELPGTRIRKTKQKLLDTALLLYQDFLTMDALDEETQSQLEAIRDYIARFLQVTSEMDGMPPLFLLTHPPVQRDLQLSETQRTEILEYCDRMKRHGEAIFRQSRDRKPEERLELLAESIRQSESFLQKILTTPQKRRLREIELQVRPDSLCDEKVILALELSDEQVEQMMEKLAIGERERSRPAPLGVPHDKRKPHSQPQWSEQRQREELEAILTPEQRRRWQEMTGEPFYDTRDSFPPPPPERKGKRQAKTEKNHAAREEKSFPATGT